MFSHSLRKIGWVVSLSLGCFSASVKLEARGSWRPGDPVVQDITFEEEFSEEIVEEDSEESSEEIAEEFFEDVPEGFFEEAVAENSIPERFFEEIVADEILEEFFEEIAADEVLEEISEEIVADEHSEEFSEEIIAEEIPEKAPVEIVENKVPEKSPVTIVENKVPEKSPVAIVENKVPEQSSKKIAAEEPSVKVAAPKVSKKPSMKKVYNRPLLEAKVGYFFFSDPSMRDAYGRGGGDVQLSGSCPIDKMLQIYASVEYLERSGYSGGGKMSIWEIPLSFGLKPIFSLGSHVGYYFTIGPRYFFVTKHNHSSTDTSSKTIHANGLGGFANTGFLFIWGRHFTIDIFGEYSYKELHFHNLKTSQVGGITLGGGLGYCF